MVFSPDGKRLDTASYYKTARVWDADSGKELLTLIDPSGGVAALAFSPDGKRLDTASYNYTRKAESGKELLTLLGHSNAEHIATHNATYDGSSGKLQTEKAALYHWMDRAGIGILAWGLLSLAE